MNKSLLMIITFFFVYFAGASVSNQYKIKHDCRTDESSCMKFACENMWSSACKRESGLRMVREACRENYGAYCLKESTTFLTSYEYDQLKEMIPLINSCKNVSDRRCQRYTCEKLGHFTCGTLKGMIKVNEICKNF